MSDARGTSGHLSSRPQLLAPLPHQSPPSNIFPQRLAMQDFKAQVRKATLETASQIPSATPAHLEGFLQPSTPSSFTRREVHIWQKNYSLDQKWLGCHLRRQAVCFLPHRWHPEYFPILISKKTHGFSTLQFSPDFLLQDSSLTL